MSAGGRGRLVQQHDVLDPVDAERPHAFGRAAPRLEVGVPVQLEDPQRIHGAFGRLIPRCGVVPQVECPLLGQRTVQHGKQPLSLVERDSHRRVVHISAGCGLDLRQRTVDGIGVREAGRLGQRA